MKTILTLLLLSNSWFAFCIDPPIDIKRIMNSGDGKTIETAYKVNSIGEEYDLLRYLKLTPVMQTLYIKEGNCYDAIKTYNKTIYFKLVNKKQNKTLPLVI